MATKKPFCLTLTKGTLFKGEENPDIELLTERNTTKKVENNKSSEPDFKQNPGMCNPMDQPEWCFPDAGTLKQESGEADEENEPNQETPSP